MTARSDLSIAPPHDGDVAARSNSIEDATEIDAPKWKRGAATGTHRREDAQSGKSGLGERKSPPGSKFLIVDDDEDHAEAVAYELDQRGHQVTLARTGKEADEKLSAEPFDALVIDGLLPDVDGISWIAAFRCRDKTTPIVFASGYHGFVESLRRLAHELRIAHIVEKPIDIPSLCDEIDRASVLENWEPPPPPSSAALALKEAVTEYASTLAQRIDDLDDIAREAARAGNESPWCKVLLEEIQSRAHRLRGTAGSYGFPAVGDAVGAIEDAAGQLLAGASPSPAGWVALTSALARARAAVTLALR